MANRRGKVETVTDFIFGGAAKSLQIVIAAVELKHACSTPAAQFQKNK